MTAFFMIGIILCGIVGFVGLAGTIYGNMNNMQDALDGANN